MPAIKARSTDSLRNWKTRELFTAPATFRMPTSFARFSLLAVDRFMKLIQAISNTKAAMMPRILTVSILPPTGLPFSKLEYSLRLLTGYRKISVFARPPEYWNMVFFIFSLVAAADTLGFSRTKVRMEKSVQSLSTHPLEVLRSYD